MSKFVEEKLPNSLLLDLLEHEKYNTSFEQITLSPAAQSFLQQQDKKTEIPMAYAPITSNLPQIVLAGDTNAMDID